MRSSNARAVLALVLIALAGCASRTRPAAASATMVFEIDASAAEGPVYVSVGGSDDQPGWVSLRNATGRVYLRPRCSVATCGEEAAVCGAAIPFVRNIGRGGALRSAESSWDRRTSVVDTIARCQRRQPAEVGTYFARFCYARAAVTEGQPIGTDIMGRLVEPTCVEQSFTLSDARVTFRVPNRDGD